MTGFRRFVIGVAEAMQVLSMILCTLVGGLFGAASGVFRSSMYGLATGVNVSGIGEVATTGAVVGFCLGAIGGFVLSSTLAGIMFAFAQIERNTRSLILNEINDIAIDHSNEYRATPRF